MKYVVTVEVTNSITIPIETSTDNEKMIEILARDYLVQNGYYDSHTSWPSINLKETFKIRAIE